MNLPRRRRSRPRGQARLALTGDFPDDRDITEELRAIPPAPWHGTTIPLAAGTQTVVFGGASDIGVMPAPAAILPMPQARAVMSIYPPGPGIPAPTPQALEVVRYLRAKVAILRMRGQLDRISDEKLAMLPGLSRRTTARVIVDEAAELLRCGGSPS